MIKSRRLTAGDEHCDNCIFLKQKDKNVVVCTKDGATRHIKGPFWIKRKLSKLFEVLVCDLYKRRKDGNTDS